MEITENKFRPQKTSDGQADIEPQTEQLPPVYDPKKRYKWEPDDKFILTGSDFGLILNSLRKIMNTPEAQTILLVERATMALEEALASAVAKGIVKEDVKK